MKKFLCSLFLLLMLCAPSIGQTVDGTQNPSAISDAIAYRMLFVALGGNPIFAKSFQKELSLTQSDKTAMQSAVDSFESSFQSQVISVYPTDPAQALLNRDNLVTSTETTMSQNLSAAGYSAVDSFVQNRVKSNTAYNTQTGLTMTAFFASGSDCGYVCDFPPDGDEGLWGDEMYILDGAPFACISIQTTSYTFNGGNIWQGFDDAATAFAGISASQEGTTYGVTSAGAVYAFNPFTRHFDLKPGTMTQVSVGNGPTVYGVNSAQQVFKFDNVANVWNQVSGASLTQVSVSPDGTSVWGVNASHQLYQLVGSSFVLISGQTANYVVALNDSLTHTNPVRIIGTDNKIYAYTSSNHTWTQVLTFAPVFTKIAQSGTALTFQFYGVTASNQIYTCTASACTLVSGHTAKGVTLGSPQDILTLDTNGHIQRFLPTFSGRFVDIMNPNQDYVSITHSVFVANLNPGQVIDIPTTTSTSDNCGSYLTVSFHPEEEIAYTRSISRQFPEPGFDCRVLNHQTYCTYYVKSWCTGDTTPPDWDPPEAEDAVGHQYWDGLAVCIRPLPNWPWTCSRGVSIGKDDIGFQQAHCDYHPPHN